MAYFIQQALDPLFQRNVVELKFHLWFTNPLVDILDFWQMLKCDLKRSKILFVFVIVYPEFMVQFSRK